ncbi:MAG: CocE/NonD family hydrolase [Acidimicrobiia bacterium]|nr:CocE/NonD family hydrolase [Acidimicrobiia bacterium]
MERLFPRRVRCSPPTRFAHARTLSLGDPGMSSRLVALVATLSLVATLTVTVAAPAPSAEAAGGGVVPGLDGADPASFAVSPGVEQVTITEAEARHPYTIVDESGERLLTLYSDDLGQLTFSYLPTDYLVFDPNEGGILPTADGSTVPPGTYRIVDEEVDPIEASEPFDVLAVDDVPDDSFYENQTVEEGFGYVTTHDGVELSVMVRFPDPAIRDLWGLPENGPFPTVVEYSGYSPSNPEGAGAPGSMIANLMGFATVGINIRGTGCSGGVFDVFNAAQRADGYDAIEAIARQDWVAGNQVGMVGLSYSGILQLYAASTTPPSLSAITPLSVIEDPWDQQWPGGIYNSGFTQEWLAQRDQDASGQVGWVQDLVEGGDETCEENLELRSQNIDFEDFGASLERRPLDADSRNLSMLVQDIDVPVYLSGGWQDEQTGSQFGDLLDDFDSSPTTKFRVYNGRHPDGYTPINLSRWYEHLSFYVKEETPEIPQSIRDAAPVLLESEFGVPGLEFEDDRFTGEPDYASAVQAYRDTPDVDVLWDFGAGRPDYPGAPVPRSSSTFESWPPPADEWRMFLGPDGSLVDQAPAEEDVQRYAFDEEAPPVAYADESGADFIKPQIDADWDPMQEGNGLAFESEPLDGTTVIAGDGHVELWFRSDGSDAAVEVLLTEVYPGGEEVLVQHGLHRAAYPDLDPAASDGTTKRHLFYEDDHDPLADGELRHLQIPIYPVAHPFREGSRVRLSINTPGRDEPIWSYVTDDYGRGLPGGRLRWRHPSSVVLPLVSDVAGDVVPTAPPCNSLRGQPCREFVPVENPQGCASPRFTDLTHTNPFCVAISSMAAAGTTEGYPDGSFGTSPTAAASGPRRPSSTDEPARRGRRPHLRGTALHRRPHRQRVLRRDRLARRRGDHRRLRQRRLRSHPDGDPPGDHRLPVSPGGLAERRGSRVRGASLHRRPHRQRVLRRDRLGQGQRHHRRLPRRQLPAHHRRAPPGPRRVPRSGSTR